MSAHSPRGSYPLIPSREGPEDPSLPKLLECTNLGQLDPIKKLVEGQNRSQDYLYSGICSAAGAGHVEVVRFFLEQGTGLTKVASRALESGSIPIFELLLEFGWDVNHPEPHGKPILPAAFWHEDLVRWLLDHGAEPNLGEPPYWEHAPVDSRANPKSGDSLNSAAACSSIEILDLLLEYGGNLEYSVALHKAASSCKEDAERIPMMEHLLELGMDINGLDDMRGLRGSGTPLHHAALVGATARAKFLVEHGADPHKKNRKGESARYEAMKRGHQEMVELFGPAPPREPPPGRLNEKPFDPDAFFDTFMRNLRRQGVIPLSPSH